METQQARLHALIEGRVQGVAFRAFVQQRASQLGLNGWVRNLWDGSVEVEAEGARQDVEKLLSALHRGPSSAFVSHVNVSWSEPIGEKRGFTIRRTGT